jgi:hypothetical protein
MKIDENRLPGRVKDANIRRPAKKKPKKNRKRLLQNYLYVYLIPEASFSLC